MILYQYLSDFFSEIKVREDISENLDEVKKLINKIKVVLSLNGEHKNSLLLAFQNKIDDIELWQQEQEKRLIKKRKEDELMQMFQQELTELLDNYEKEYQSKKHLMSQVRQHNLCFLRQALKTAQVGKELYSMIEQYYKTISCSFFAKWSPLFDGSILRYSLRNLLDNPTYSVFKQTFSEGSVPEVSNSPMTILN